MARYGTPSPSSFLYGSKGTSGNVKLGGREAPQSGRPGASSWSVALCINQADVDERSQQVRLMRDIFQGANRVTAWLSEEKDSNTLALDMIERWMVAYANHGTDIPAVLQTVDLPRSCDSPKSNSTMRTQILGLGLC